jgi:hexosaminidase
MSSMRDVLVPSPQSFEEMKGTFVFPGKVEILIRGDVVPGTGGTDHRYLIARWLQRKLAEQGIASAVSIGGRRAQPLRVPPASHIVLHLDPNAALKPQGYRLVVESDRIELTSADEAGLFYGVATLAQMVAAQADASGVALPAAHVVDWPDFANRGVMLDVSRDRVPMMETLYDLVDLLASWKINEVQLYMEHTFAYGGHEIVWKDASPFTGEEILALDAYCRERFIDLVPNQNSFGHMHRWHIHEPYRQLAECPDGIELWPGSLREPFSLCPLDPGSLDLLGDLYDQLLPHFSSKTFNVGLDETFDLGKGRSAEACAEKGTELVYLDFLKKIHTLVSDHGKKMQFWGDIILHEPALIPELPRDAVALEWGYEATHPFLEHTRQFADAGLEFYVCPGTSSWNTIAGRTENALLNIQSAARHGKETGAVGLLNTDWGDNGHMQPLSVSYLGFMAGAAAGWNAATPLMEAAFAEMLDLFAFRDSAGVMGRVAYDLGNAYKLPGVEPSNASILFHLLLNPDQSLAKGRAQLLTPEALAHTVKAITAIRGRLDQAKMARDDAAWIVEEFALAADLLRWSAEFAGARMSHGARDTVAALPAQVRAGFAGSMRDLIARYRQAWLRRSRPGGLQDSSARLERVAAVLET